MSREVITSALKGGDEITLPGLGKGAANNLGNYMCRLQIL